MGNETEVDGEHLVQLTGMLGEFVTALKEEIDAARISAYGKTIKVISGRKIGHIGNDFQYVFSLNNAINLPDDSPGELHLPNHKTINATIISIDGLSIILSCSEDLGQFVPTGNLASDLTFLMKKLIVRIEECSAQVNVIGDRILSNSIGSDTPRSRLVNAPENLDDGQKHAIKSSLGRDITFIWGPPGTGKTRTIGVIGQQLRLEKRSLLMVSHTNTAVDQALVNIADAINDEESVRAGKLIRIGIPQVPKSKTTPIYSSKPMWREGRKNCRPDLPD